MTQVKTRSTSQRTATVDPIILREGERVRLVFVPTLVDNSRNAKASVNGCFVYQKKLPSGRWSDVRTLSLSSLREGDEFKLTLHADELWNLLQRLVPLYTFYETTGIPKGQKTFVQVSDKAARLIERGGDKLVVALENNEEDIIPLLLAVAQSLSASDDDTRRKIIERLTAMPSQDLPAITALFGVAAMKNALSYWRQNESNSSEEFWQKAISERAYVLGQVFSYPVVVITEKAYLGGKQLNKKGGKEVDFLMKAESTDAIALVELKTPLTSLLGAEYRDGVFPFSRDLTAAVAQALKYRQTIMRKFDSVTSDAADRLTLGEPKCVVIAGQTNQLDTTARRESFELQRERLQGVTVLTYDELFRRVERLLDLLEGRI
jgi:hypothetical protein